MWQGLEIGRSFVLEGARVDAIGEGDSFLLAGACLHGVPGARSFDQPLADSRSGRVSRLVLLLVMDNLGLTISIEILLSRELCRDEIWTPCPLDSLL